MLISKTNNIASYKLHIECNEIKLTVAAQHSKSAKYAVYLLSSNGQAIEKKWYQESGSFSFLASPDTTYYLKIYVQRGDEKNSFTTERFTTPTKSVDTTTGALEAIIAGKELGDSLSALLSGDAVSLSAAFGKIRSVVHGAFRWDDRFRTEFSTACLGFCSTHEHTPAQFKFAMNCVTYVSASDFLEQHYREILQLIQSNAAVHPRDAVFWTGLLNYKVGNFFSAQEEFQSLLGCKNELEYHQTGSISYFHRWRPDPSKRTPPKKINLLKKGNAPGPGVVLISCDYGYFASYFEKTIRKLLSSGVVIHVHLVLPRGMAANDLQGIDHECIGISYEHEEDIDPEKNLKTYFSIARYLVCQQILEEYKKPVLVADIDIDFDFDVQTLFAKIDSTDIALVFGKAGFPWLNILAGFNLFGADTANGEFLTYLRDFLSFCYGTGRDGWMLDQTALDAAFRHMSSTANIRDMEEVKDFSVRQYQNRAMHRKTALEARKSLAPPSSAAS